MTHTTNKPPNKLTRKDALAFIHGMSMVEHTVQLGRLYRDDERHKRIIEFYPSNGKDITVHYDRSTGRFHLQTEKDTSNIFRVIDHTNFTLIGGFTLSRFFGKLVRSWEKDRNRNRVIRNRTAGIKVRDEILSSLAESPK